MGRGGFESRQGSKIFYMTQEKFAEASVALTSLRSAESKVDRVYSALHGGVAKISLYLDGGYVCELHPGELQALSERLTWKYELLRKNFEDL